MRSRWQAILNQYQTPLLVLIYFANYPLLYLMNVLLSRWLGAADYGDYAAARSVGALAATVALLGLDRACLQFLPIYKNQGKAGTAKGFIYFAAVVVLVFGTILSIVGYLVLEFIRVRWGADEHPMVLAMILVVPMSFVAFLIKLLASQARALAAAFTNQILFPILIIGLLAVVFVISNHVTEFTAIQLLVIGYTLIVVLLLWLFRSIWSSTYQRSPTDLHPREWLYSSSSLLLTALVITALQQSGTLVMEALHADESAVGLFAAVKQVALLPLLALGALSLLAVPELSVLLGNQAYEQATTRLGFYLRILLGIGLGAFVIFTLWGDAMLEIFNSTFSDGHTALIILSAGYIFTLLGGLTVPTLQILGANRTIFISMTALLVLNLALSIALIPTFGPVGASSAYTLSVLIIYAWQIYWLQKHSEVRYLPSIFSFGRGADMSAQPKEAQAATKR